MKGKMSKKKADYWKSQPRKECEFCKCWIADNKPSIVFHENGKRHKENVAKRLSDIGKKSAQDAKNKIQVDVEMQKMEQAALKAYMKDIEKNADFTSQLVIKELEEKQKKREEEAVKAADARKAKEMAKQNEHIEIATKRKRALEKAAAIKWYEAMSDEGYTYYWHVDTNESKWDPPEVGYISISEQKVIEDGDKKSLGKKDFKRKEKGKKPPTKKRKPPQDSAVSQEKKCKSETKIIPVGPAPKPEPYGRWKTVETQPIEAVDLQLPSSSSTVVRAPVVVEQKPKITFQEKKIIRPLEGDNEQHSSFVRFKKKSGFRGNARQRLDTDD